MTINAQIDSRKLLDYDELFSRGMELVEQFSAQTWTDYNSHDPGITILEFLCYNLTDLALRTAYPFADLVAEEKADAQAEVAKHFFQAHEILTHTPTTYLDYRKLILSEDHIHNVTLQTPEYDSEIVQDQNKPDETLLLNGIYEVYLELDDDAGEAVRQQTIKKLNLLLQNNRNLCEDFLPIKQFPDESVSVLADVEVEHDAKSEDVLANIAMTLDRFVSPPISSRTLQEVLDAGVATDKIFNGPRTKYFFDNDELNKARRKSEIHISDIINEIMAVDGVLSIRRMNVSSYYSQNEQTQAGDGMLKLQDRHTVRFSLEKSQLRLFKNGVEQNLSETMVKHKVRVNKIAEMKPPVKLEENVLDLANGSYLDLAQFKSIQHDFPAIYKLAAHGLSAEASAEEHAYVKQLRAYLSMFDRFLADYLANLAQAKNMFSINSQDRLREHSFFVQGTDMPDEEEIFKNYETYLESLGNLAEPPKCRNKRRNTFLNHLLARFAMDFSNYEFIALDKESNHLFKARVAIKGKFLENFDRLSHDRGKGINGTRKSEATAMEECFRILLETEQVYLVEHILLRPRGSNSTVMSPYYEASGEVENSDPYSFTISIILPAWISAAEDLESRELIEKAVRNRLPAHVFARIYWLDYEQLDDFEQAYNIWRSEFVQVCTGEITDIYTASQNNLVRLLENLSSVSLSRGDATDRGSLGGVVL
ncbi:hypothetical protein BVY04_04700 [bacterium M21]|nr:hypothetical protein BVY04_04700 [bacterium M21]